LVVLLVRRLAFVPSRIVLNCPTTISLLPRSAVKKTLERLLLAWIYPWADEIVTVSHGVALDLSYYTGIPLSRINTIYNPVITPDIPEKAMGPVNHLWFGQIDRSSVSIPVVLSLGRLNNEKSFSTLIRAFAIVREKMPCRLMILGEGKERQRLEELANKLGILSELFMPGFVENPFAYLSKASVFVLSSVLEGLPSVLIQALACGCPVVSTDCPSGPFEILNGGEYGHLVPVGDVQAMADAIMKVLAGDLRKPPAEWLRQFELETVIHQYLNIMGIPYTRFELASKNERTKSIIT
jgi:glycosyltransferase involved in cell wall biosynthesis